MTKRKSGGARDVERKQAQRDAARQRDPETVERLKASRRALATPPNDATKAPDYILRALMALAVEAMLDDGPPPEQSREQAARILGQAAKSVDAARLRAELDQLYALMEKPANAASVRSGEDREPPSPSTN